MIFKFLVSLLLLSGMFCETLGKEVSLQRYAQAVTEIKECIELAKGKDVIVVIAKSLDVNRSIFQAQVAPKLWDGFRATHFTSVTEDAWHPRASTYRFPLIKRANGKKDVPMSEAHFTVLRAIQTGREHADVGIELWYKDCDADKLRRTFEHTPQVSGLVESEETIKALLKSGAKIDLFVVSVAYSVETKEEFDVTIRVYDRNSRNDPHLTTKAKFTPKGKFVYLSEFK